MHIYINNKVPLAELCTYLYFSVCWGNIKNSCTLNEYIAQKSNAQNYTSIIISVLHVQKTSHPNTFHIYSRNRE
jgi:hypothetical protein